jgi:hypothetical protein
MYFAFGVIFKEKDLPFYTFKNTVLTSKKVSNDTWVAVLKESVREFPVNTCARSINIHDMNTTHFSYLEEFLHAFRDEVDKTQMVPEWILCKD